MELVRRWEAARRRLRAQVCWSAVLSRDARRDADFVFAVRSTGIYCRPSCPARRPDRSQVVFFPEPDAAERHGFRPCRRCRPREAAKPDRVGALVQKAARYIRAHAEEPVKLSALAAALGCSPGHLQRTFRRATGISPRQFAEALRLRRFKSGVRSGSSVTDSLYEAGFGSSSRLYERSNAQLGMTPATYGRGGEGMKIGYTIVRSPLGRLLVAATERGISAVYLGDADAPLRRELRQEYPRAEIHPAGGEFSRWVRALLKYLSGTQPKAARAGRLDLPLDVRATAFQQRVWQELRRIPYGATRTYGQIARALGKPAATRAVARACATNPVSVVVPCHRVIRQDGSLAGYRWGLKRKQALLAREGAAAGKSAHRSRAAAQR